MLARLEFWFGKILIFFFFFFLVDIIHLHNIVHVFDLASGAFLELASPADRLLLLAILAESPKGPAFAPPGPPPPASPNETFNIMKFPVEHIEIIILKSNLVLIILYLTVVFSITINYFL